MCDDDWDITDANVACRQLGFGGATSAPGQGSFGEGSGPIYYDNVDCSGTETRLADCTNAGIGVHNCVHSDDAGVVCYAVAGQLRNVAGALIQQCATLMARIWLHVELFTEIQTFEFRTSIFKHDLHGSTAWLQFVF